MSVSKKSKVECCGCNACAEICPRKCIIMRHDYAGFLYPDVNQEECVECGLCERACPLDKSDYASTYPLACYAARRRDPASQSGSSSGGAAAAICKKIVGRGGVAYGCTADGISVSHIRIDKPEELARLQGSKYVQSDTRGIYSLVRQDLTDGKDVVFIGTPCQTYGLKKFLRKNYDNLLLVDLICHGVPSQKMLQEHIRRVSRNKKIDRMAFRNGNNFRLQLFAGNEIVWAADHWAEPGKDVYYKGFMEGLTYRPSCHACKFARQERFSDITIGDFWGLKDKSLFRNDGNSGTSVILPASEKGLQFVAEMRDEMTLFERSVGEAVQGNTQLRHPVAQRAASKIFFILYRLLPFDSAISAVYRCGDVAFAIKKAVRNVLRR